MPPKCKFSKKEIVQAALDLVRAEGMDSVTARAVGARLGASSKPVFSVFENMESLQREVVQAARDVYNQYARAGLSQPQKFKGVGLEYIRFARQEPKLFQLLFMTEQAEQTDILGVLPLIEDNYSVIAASIQEEYGLEEAAAQTLYRHLWVYTHGIASLLATNVCAFSGEEINSMLANVCQGLLMGLKGGEML